MSERVHKGWLSSRDGLKFSPYVLAEGIKNRDGSSFVDDVNSLSIDLTELKHKINKQGFSSSENAFYIVDAAGYIIFCVDENGVHSTDYSTYNSTGELIITLNELYEQLLWEAEQRSQTDIAINKRIQHIDVSNDENETVISAEHPLNLPRITKGNSDTFYITDDRGYIIFQVNSDGVTTTDVTLKNNLKCITYEIEGFIPDFEEKGYLSVDNISALDKSVLRY